MTNRVAIITRTRNRPEFLRRAIDSVLEQTFDDWRQYVVNDGGPRAPVDAVVRAVAARSRDRILVLHLDDRLGMEAATNHALKCAREPWVTLLDDDDTWLPTFLDAAVGALEARPSAAMRGVVTHSLLVEERMDEGRPVEVRRSVFNADLEALSIERLARNNLFTNNAFLFEREAIETVGAFCEALPVYGDWDFNLRFLQSFDIGVLPSPLACWHRRITAAGDLRNSFAQDPAIAAKVRSQLTNLWLRGSGGRSSQVGILMALGPYLAEQEGVVRRVDKYLNVLHGLRQRPVLRLVDQAIRRLRG